MPIDSRQILMVLVSDSGVVKNSIIRMEKEFSKDQIMIISNFLNEELKGLTIEEINEMMTIEIFKDLFEFKAILDNMLPIISQSLEEIDNIDLYSDGITKILNFPEYKDIEKAKSFISFIENKDLVVDLMLNNLMEDDIDITIGSENIYDPIKDCSLITATYRLGDKTIGKIGVIGPTRMDYLKVIDIMHLFSVNITEIIDMLLGK